MNTMNDFNSELRKRLEEEAEQEKKNMQPGDYLDEDGLIRCGICHEPKQK